MIGSKVCLACVLSVSHRAFTRWLWPGYDGEVHPLVLDAVNWTLLRLATYMLTGQVGRRPGTAEQAQVGVACLAYLRSRVCAPRDMSAPAATQLRAACDVLLANTY